jgi:mono/diheme cytochrome c family protein
MWEVGLQISPVEIDVRNLPELEKQMVGHGSYLVNSVGQCGRCHTSSENGTEYLPGSDPFKGEQERIDTKNFLAGGHQIPMPGFGRVCSTNLTPDRNRLPDGLSEEQFVEAMRTGISPRDNRRLLAMRWPEIGKMSDCDLRAMYKYLKQIPPVERECPPSQKVSGGAPQPQPCDNRLMTWQIGLCISPVKLDLKDEVSLSDLQKIGRGSYLVNAAGQCGVCHTCFQGNNDTGDQFLSGGNPFLGQSERINKDRFMAGGCTRSGRGGAENSKTSTNLTPAPINNGMPAGFTVDEFVRALMTGRSPKDGRILQVLPWPHIGKMSDSDLRAIYAYLKQIPPIEF